MLDIMILVFPTFSTANFFFFFAAPGQTEVSCSQCWKLYYIHNIHFGSFSVEPFFNIFHWKQTNHIVPQPAEPAGDSAELLLLSTRGSGERLSLATNRDAKIEV